MLFVCRDLKRDVAKKLEKLEKRTLKAIVELISEFKNIFTSGDQQVICYKEVFLLDSVLIFFIVNFQERDYNKEKIWLQQWMLLLQNKALKPSEDNCNYW